jgi:hypothetical protein
MSSRSPLGPDSRQLFIVAACVCAGVLIAILATPKILLHMPTELSRTTEIVRALHNAPPALAVVVTGDSVTMNGVNAKLLGDELRPKCEAWNVGSPGQQLAEALFIADMLPRNVQTLVVGLLPEGLTVPTVTLPEDRYLFYRISGYQPSAEALDIARHLPAPTLYDLMAEPQWEATLSGRGLIRISADLSIRSRLRRDLDLERARTDLYFPAPYRQRISESALTHAVKLLYKPRASFEPSSQRLQFLLRLRGMLARRNQNLVIVILPEHPRSIAMTSGMYYAQFAQYANMLRSSYHFEVIDFHDRLAEPDFIDQIHPGGIGSERLTRMISASLPPQRTAS